MKYLRISKNHSNKISSSDFIVIFPDIIGHDEMAEYYGLDSIVSAGFVNLDSESDAMNFCYGESKSLNIDSYPEDDTTLLRLQCKDIYLSYENTHIHSKEEEI